MQQLGQSPRPGNDFHKVLEDVQAFVGVVRRGWRLIALGVLVAVTAAGIFLARARTVYRGAARLLVIQQSARPHVTATGDPFQNLQDSTDSLSTQLMLIKSPLIAERAIALSRVSGVSVPGVVIGLTTKLPDPTAKMIDVSYQSSSADKARRVLDGVILSYNQFLKDKYQSNTNEVISLIAKARATS
jgi:capsular polysaccharide biosynthesis protein